MAKDYDLFFVCSLFENIGRMQKLRRGDVARYFGIDGIEHVYEYADDVSIEFIEQNNIAPGNWDNIAICEYEVPTVWTMGDVYTRLITLMHKDSGKHLAEDIYDVFTSWFMDELCQLNTDLFYQVPEYQYECYKAGRILED